SFPASLPVSRQRHAIMQAMAEHQVVVVCGETGSGKTTQLPKMALALGRGRVNGGGLIGHTQPRRLAATSVAKRLAQELETPLGEVVGYQIRFQDRVGPQTSVKLMTDGILLAQTQRDPLLRAYDTIIIDEAHERSLNIDFLLGYIKHLLPQRPDLKVVVTSATIDAERFANYFAGLRGPAPVLQVSGRLYPVEVRWQPFEESRDTNLDTAIAQAVDQLWQHPQEAGDILVFLPGEREIRSAANHLRRHLAHQPLARHTEVLPLFARLTQAEQDRIFTPHQGRRIVLATNVAETSLTVPGIRYVIDSGLARVKRYSYRQKVEQLQVERISQAAAAQRAGRCGRVADGVAIRLYDEADFAKRAAFTDPEIARSSLAGVILRMKALRLGAVESFDFIEPPLRRAVADGYQLLAELGATDTEGELTETGRVLAQLPLDPRLGRMLLEAHRQQALSEVLVIASALGVPDPRDRPMEQQAAADQAHATWADERSEFVGLIALWNWLEQARGGDGQEQKLSQRQYEQRLRERFVNPRRVREWRDTHKQLAALAAEQGWRLNTQPATYEQLHLALLAGLLGNVGYKGEPDDAFTGARQIKFLPHPGVHLRKRARRWVMAAELVDTSRLYARGVAQIEPQWIERVAGHILHKEVLQPHYDAKRGAVVGYERATLYGLLVYHGRKVDYARVDAQEAHRVFVREALVEGGLGDEGFAFMRRNQQLLREVLQLEHKARRQDVLVDDSRIEAFYTSVLPPEVSSRHGLRAWLGKLPPPQRATALVLTRDDLMRHTADAVTQMAFPDLIRLGGIDCPVTYLHDPGNARDGVTVRLPLVALNRVAQERLDWLVPGMLPDKLLALLKTLPQKARARLVPLPAAAQDVGQYLLAEARYAQGDLISAMLSWLRTRTQLELRASDFKPDTLAAHLQFNIQLEDEHGGVLGIGRSLSALRAQWGQQARGAFQALAGLRAQLNTASEAQPLPAAPAAGKALAKKSGAVAQPSAAAAPPRTGSARHTTWAFGAWPDILEIERDGQTLVGFAALVDEGDAVVQSVYDDEHEAARIHRQGLRRLFALQVREPLKYLSKQLPDWRQTSLLFAPVADGDLLLQQVLNVALERAFLADPLPKDQAGFTQRLEQGRNRLTLIAQEVARQAGAILRDWAAAQRKLKDAKPPDAVAKDITQQLQRLMHKQLFAELPYAQWVHLPRYFQAVVMRLDKRGADPARDTQRMAEVHALESRFWRLVGQRQGHLDDAMAQYRWLLEELRVSLFAQGLRTPTPVSVKRLEKAWATLQR
ncbi:MAG: ATP-dependent RNA helicase HrpA, partial [Burkholderiaceae bacterium]